MSAGGERGRDLLAHYLRDERHARVVKWAFYRRVNQAQVPAFTAREVSAVIIASIQGLQAFLNLWAALAGNMSVPVIVPSQRVANAAAAAGFERVQTARDASAAAVLEALQQTAG